MGQYFLVHGTKEQQDKLKILHRPGWDFDILPRDGLGQGFDGLSCPGAEEENRFFFLNFGIFFDNFWTFCQSGSDFVLGQRGSCPCPRTKGHWDKKISCPVTAMGHPV